MHFNSSHLARAYLSAAKNKFVLHSLLHDPANTLIAGITTCFIGMSKLDAVDIVGNYAIRVSVLRLDFIYVNHFRTFPYILVIHFSSISH